MTRQYCASASPDWLQESSRTMSQVPTDPPPAAAPNLPWHALPVPKVRALWGVDPEGLNPVERERRRARYGANTLQIERRRGPLQRLLLQFHHVLVYIMLAGAGVTALLGHAVDAAVLAAAVLVNVVIGFIQEGRAEAALAAIRAMLSPRAVILCGGQRQEVDATSLVPGDLVLLASGDRVPADLRLVDAHGLRVEEAALTGESIPADKDNLTTTQDAPIGERTGMAYCGTLVTCGQATGIVVATGTTTELGRIDRMLADIPELDTPLLRQIERFGRVLAIVILTAAAVTYVLGVLARGHSAAEMFMMAVALAAAAIPEGLPAIMTVTLALGVQRMARRNAIVRRLPAVETLGSVTVICSDKTGTLTRNEMTVQRIVCAGQTLDVSGVGYDAAGTFTSEGRPVEPAQQPVLTMAIRAGVLCNDACLQRADSHWTVVGDPTEGALLVLGRKAGLLQDECARAWRRIDSIPFESQHRYMATRHVDEAGQAWIFIKGAPERILELCAYEASPHGAVHACPALEVEAWHQRASENAARGMRLLAVACRRVPPPDGRRLSHRDIAGGFTLLALMGMLDPPREEAVRAVAQCHRAGIRVKMITGDHAETARAIGARLGVGVGRPVLTGSELALMDDVALRRVALEVDVFARASPEHKLRLVEALQSQGQVVAMTGDGVNDAPALKRADIGVAMGRKGTEAAKEACDMVLADDNFATIAAAVREGRAVYDNLRKFILFALPTNGGEALVVIAAVLFDLALPITPAQILWVNMVTSITLGVALAFEPAEQDLMDRRPRPPGEPLLSGFFAWRVLMVSVLMMAAALGLFLWEVSAGTPVETARTVAVSTLVAAEMFYLLNSRFVLQPSASARGLTGNPLVWWTLGACLALQLGFVHLPAMQSVFGSTHLSPTQWGRVALAGLAVFLVIEAEKWILRRGPWRRRMETQNG